MYKILVAEDDPIMLNMVEKLMVREGHQVFKTTSAAGVEASMESVQPDLLLIDVNLPDKNGLTLCRELRETMSYADVPIVFLTGSPAGPDDIATALNAGGDDFIHKPFAAKELAARVRAQLRRVSFIEDNAVTQLTLDPQDLTVTIDDERVAELTRVEFNLLSHMCEQPNTWQTTRQLLADVWRYPGNIGDAALVRNHIRNIRLKIEENPDHPAIILSRHRRGYLIDAKIEKVESSVS